MKWIWWIWWFLTAVFLTPFVVVWGTIVITLTLPDEWKPWAALALGFAWAVVLAIPIGRVAIGESE